MRDISFIKMHGAGNDFVVIDARAQDVSDQDPGILARKLCDRHFGIGADGLIFVLPSKKADYRMRIFNPDGSEPEMCGNGIRCFSRYVYESSGGKKEVFSVETLAGIKVPTIIAEDGAFMGVEVDMGVPAEEGINEDLIIDGHSFKMNKISMGNPHCVIFVKNLSDIDLPQLGPIIENLPQFPNRTNVEFTQVLGRNEIEVKVWERGAGITLACGTGACAAAVAAILNNLTEKKVIVHLPGGDLGIEWSADGHVIMRGPAETVFEGKVNL